MPDHYPAPKEGDWFLQNFRFRNGDVMPIVRMHYRTIGDPTKDAVLILHGTNRSGADFLTPEFAGQLFGPGQPLDATQYFIVLPDNLGAGKSSKPSDGLRARFPRYGYADMVAAQRMLVVEGLGLRNLRLVLGNSMGGMHAWMWGVAYPSFMDAIIPLAAEPAQLCGRNWMLRRMLIETVRNDPEWRGGDYVSQPRAFRLAHLFFFIAADGGTRAYHRIAPTREKADQLLEARLAAPLALDANDCIHQWEAASDYDPGPDLHRIKAAVLAINSADDERNPPELGALPNELSRLPNAQMYMIPASETTCGHETTTRALFWKEQLRDFLAVTARRQTNRSAEHES